MKKTITTKYKVIDIDTDGQKEPSYINFKVYDIFAENLQTGEIEFEKKGTDNLTTTTNKEDAKTILEGSIKWDGCSDVRFGDDNGYIHNCDGFITITNLLKKIHKEAQDIFSKNHSDMWDDIE